MKIRKDGRIAMRMLSGREGGPRDEFSELAGRLRFRRPGAGFDWKTSFSRDGKTVEIYTSVSCRPPSEASEFENYASVFLEAARAYRDGTRKFEDLGRRLGVRVKFVESYGF